MLDGKRLFRFATLLLRILMTPSLTTETRGIDGDAFQDRILEIVDSLGQAHVVHVAIQLTFLVQHAYDTIRPFLKSIQARSVVVVADGYPLDFLPFQVLLQLLKVLMNVKLLQFLIGKIYAELFQAVDIQNFEAVDIEQPIREYVFFSLEIIELI